jgi:hypothetical protein
MRAFIAGTAVVAMLFSAVAAAEPVSTVGKVGGAEPESSAVDGAEALPPRYETPPVEPDAFATLQTGNMAVEAWDGSQSALDDLVEGFAGEGIRITDVSYRGHPGALGIYTSGDLGTSEPWDGLVLSTGYVTSLTSPNPSASLGQPGDSRLTELAGRTTYDAAIIDIDFVPTRSSVRFDYLFASEEWPTYVGAGYNDTFAFWVNGENCALNADDQPVSVDASNFSSASHLQLGTSGVTHPLSCIAATRPGLSNTMTLAIADSGDSILDSAVFLRAESLDSDGRVRANPLLMIHGWTGTVDHWDAAFAYAESHLDPAVPRERMNVGPWTPSWDSRNSPAIVEEARNLFRQTGRPVNLIGHSKGGLDSRLAMLLEPHLFSQLVTLATPNAGSYGADLSCAAGRGLDARDGEIAQRGRTIWAPRQKRVVRIDCDDIDNFGAVTQLRLATSAMFNRTFQNPAGKPIYVAAGEGGGITANHLCPRERDGVRTIRESGQFVPYGAGAFLRSDQPVCLRSAFALSEHEAQFNSGRDAYPLMFLQRGRAIFELNHGAMRSDACPVSLALSLSVPPSAFTDNPWRDGAARGCAGYRQPTFNRDGFTPLQAAAASGPAIAVDDGTPDNGVVAAVVEQYDLDLTADDRSVEIAIPGDDGHHEVVVRHDAADLQVLADGVATERRDREVNDRFVVDAFPLPVGTETFTVVGQDGSFAEFTLLALVDGSTEPYLHVDEPEPGQLDVRLVDPRGVGRAALLAVDGPQGADDLVDLDTATPVRVVAQPGELVVLTAALQAPARTLHLRTRATDERISVGNVSDQHLLDEDGDGQADALRVTVPVSLPEGNARLLTVDLVGDGDSVARAVAIVDGDASNATFTFDLAVVQRAALSHTGLHFANAVVLQDLDAVASVDGPLGDLDLELAAPDRSLLLDAGGVLRPDGALEFHVDLAKFGEQEEVVEATVVGPDEQTLVSESLIVGPGDERVTVVVPAEQVEKAGPGTYWLTDLTLHALGSFDVTSRLGDVALVVLEPSEPVDAVVVDEVGPPVLMAPASNEVRAGSTVPVRFRLVDAEGAPVENAAVIAELAAHLGECGSTATDAVPVRTPGNSVLRATSDGWWHVNWQTDRAWAGSCVVVRAGLVGGEDLVLHFTLQ